jgi:hypothetical protein
MPTALRSKYCFQEYAMKRLNTWLAFALLSSAALALADPPAQVGRLSYLYGTVSFAPADAPNEWAAAPINRPITHGDRLWADNDGRAEIRIGSTAVRLAALTSVDVLRLDELGVQLRLAQGTLNVHLRRLDAGDSFEISTPGGAVLLTQPGQYRVNVDPAGAATSVLVRRGQADVLTNNAPYAVQEQQLSVFSTQGQETFAAPAPDEFDNWAVACDRLEERAVATRYVHPEMTGYEDLDHHGSWRTVAEYGAVWVPTTVAAGWAPYRQGHWVWISPWGWTWVDNAPWGFAPYHYGRWVWLSNHWGWAPGARTTRPVYAPALVAFVGGANWSASVRSGPAVGWVPLGWREPYIPWYRHSPAYVRNVNVTHVTNVNVINHYGNVTNVTNIRYVNRDVPLGTTVVTRDTFVRARHVHGATLDVPAHTLAAARVTHEAPVTQPERASLIAARPGPRLPAAIAAREVVATNAPPALAREVRDGQPFIEPGRSIEHDRRVRVLNTQPRSTVAAPAAAAITPTTPTNPPAAPAATPAAPPVPPSAPAAQRAQAVPQPPPPEPRAPGRELRANTPPPAQGPMGPMPAQAEAQRQQQQAQQEQQRHARGLAQQQQQMQQQQQLQTQQQEQQRQARALAHQEQQARLQQQKEQQHQLLQQRTHQVQQQREVQFQQAQQIEQQRQLKQQQHQVQRQAERAEKQRRNEPQPPQNTPPAAR